MITKLAKFVDRTEAGQLLATKLKPYANRSDTIVLGLPLRKLLSIKTIGL